MSLNIVVGAIRDRPLYFSGEGLKGLAVPPPRQKTTFTRKKHFLKTFLYMKIRYFLFKFLKYIEKFRVTLLFFFAFYRSVNFSIKFGVKMSFSEKKPQPPPP